MALVVISGTLGAVFVPKLAWLAMELRGVDIKAVSTHGGDSHNGVARGGGRKVARRSKSDHTARTRRRDTVSKKKNAAVVPPHEMSDVELGPPKNKSATTGEGKQPAKRGNGRSTASTATEAQDASGAATTDVVNPLNR